jgi:hypothetical protein
MKKIFVLALVALLAACNSTSTGGVAEDSSDKVTSSDSIRETPATPQLTDTTLPRPGDSAGNMIDTASSNVKMMLDTAKKMKAKM